ncbi:NHLP leader peptide domain-containing protein [Paenibacillaceae bacterium GAS479]|nr:NHLP leader peptide domain-containing protein [Paenibacillaceae bacterium GAS479]
MSSSQSLKVQIIQKAWKDEAFKQQLLADPKTAIKDAFGVEIPDDIQLTAVAESDKNFYFVLPPNPEDVANGTGNVELMW